MLLKSGVHQMMFSEMQFNTLQNVLFSGKTKAIDLLVGIVNMF